LKDLDILFKHRYLNLLRYFAQKKFQNFSYYIY
jgi:hypothetical protein